MRLFEYISALYEEPTGSILIFSILVFLLIYSQTALATMDPKMLRAMTEPKVRPRVGALRAREFEFRRNFDEGAGPASFGMKGGVAAQGRSTMSSLFDI